MVTASTGTSLGVEGNGPTTGNGNRNRNTLRNIASKKGAPLLSPTTGFGFATQIAGLQMSLAGAMALQRAQIAMARGDFQSAGAEARQLRIEETAAAVNNALDRGIVGSSVDYGQRAKAVTDAAAYRAQARRERDMAIAQARIGGISAVGQFYTGLGQVQAQKSLSQAELAIQQYQADQFDVLNQDFLAMQQSVLAKLKGKGRRRDVQASAFAPFTDVNPGGVL